MTTNRPLPLPPKKKTHHGFHLFLTVITVGGWIPVWIILEVTNEVMYQRQVREYYAQFKEAR